MTSDDASFQEWLRHGPVRLNDCRTRFWWGNTDGEPFDAGVRDLLDTHPYSTLVTVDRHGGSVRWHKVIDPADERARLGALAKLLVSYLDHVRAGLNYLVYELAPSP